MDSALAPFVKAGKTIQKHIDGIVVYIATGLSSGRTEEHNGNARTITRTACGFHDASVLVAMLCFCCSGIWLQPAHTVPSFHHT